MGLSGSENNKNVNAAAVVTVWRSRIWKGGYLMTV